VFATYFFALGLLGLAAVSGGLVDPAHSFGFVSIGALQALGYAVIVWLFVVRTGALSWSAMGWPTWQGGARRCSAIGLAVAMLPTTFVMPIPAASPALLGVEA
jgi:hypothetical protein